MEFIFVAATKSHNICDCVWEDDGETVGCVTGLMVEPDVGLMDGADDGTMDGSHNDGADEITVGDTLETS